jgi:RNA polymerase-interacting CarD/CdnL/TRCF family regulator
MNNGEKVEPGTSSEATKRGEKYLIRKIRNVDCDKHVEVTVVEVSEVAMIVAVPEDDADLAELESLVDSQPVLNHTYSTLEDAINDAQMINEERDRNGLKVSGYIVELDEVTVRPAK